MVALLLLCRFWVQLAIGVVVNDTLVLITHLNRKLSDNSMSIELIAKGVTQRLRAVVLTSLTTIVGVLALAYGIGRLC